MEGIAAQRFFFGTICQFYCVYRQSLEYFCGYGGIFQFCHIVEDKARFSVDAYSCTMEGTFLLLFFMRHSSEASFYYYDMLPVAGLGVSSYSLVKLFAGVMSSR